MDLLSPPSTRSASILHSSRWTPAHHQHYLGNFPTEESFYDEEGPSARASTRAGGMSFSSSVGSSSDGGSTPVSSMANLPLSPGGRSAVPPSSSPQRLADHNNPSPSAAQSPSPPSFNRQIPSSDHDSDFSTTSAASTTEATSQTGSNWDSDESCSSVEQVFLGRARSSKERRLIAKLNAELAVVVSPAGSAARTPPVLGRNLVLLSKVQGPAPLIPTPIATSSLRSRIPLGSSIASRSLQIIPAEASHSAQVTAKSARTVKKRDSREFNRRKTLAFSRRETIGMDEEGFTEAGCIPVADGGAVERKRETRRKSELEQRGSQRRWEGGFFERASHRQSPFVQIPRSEAALSEISNTRDNSPMPDRTSVREPGSDFPPARAQSIFLAITTVPILQAEASVETSPNDEGISSETRFLDAPTSTEECGEGDVAVASGTGARVQTTLFQVTAEENIDDGAAGKASFSQPVDGTREMIHDTLPVGGFAALLAFETLPEQPDAQEGNIAAVPVAERDEAGLKASGTGDDQSDSSGNAEMPSQEADEEELLGASTILPTAINSVSVVGSGTVALPTLQSPVSVSSPSQPVFEGDSEGSPLPLPRGRGSPAGHLSVRANLRGEAPSSAIRLPVIGQQEKGVSLTREILAESPVASIPISNGLGDFLDAENRLSPVSRGSPVSSRTPSREAYRSVLGMATPKRMEPLLSSAATPAHPLLTSSMIRSRSVQGHTHAPGPSRLFKQAHLPGSGGLDSTPQGPVNAKPGSHEPRRTSPRKETREQEKVEARRQAISSQLDGVGSLHAVMATPQRPILPQARRPQSAGKALPTPMRGKLVPQSVPRSVAGSAGPHGRVPLTPTGSGNAAGLSTSPHQIAPIRKLLISPRKVSPKKPMLSRIPQKQAVPGSSKAAASQSTAIMPARAPIELTPLVTGPRPISMAGPMRPKSGLASSSVDSPAKKFPRPIFAHGVGRLGTATSTYANSPIKRSPVGRSTVPSTASAPARPGSTVANRSTIAPTPTRPISLSLSGMTGRPVHSSVVAGRLAPKSSRLGLQISGKSLARPPIARCAATALALQASASQAKDAAERPARADSPPPASSGDAADNHSGERSATPLGDQGDPSSDTEASALSGSPPGASASVTGSKPPNDEPTKADPDPQPSASKEGRGSTVRPKRILRPAVTVPAPAPAKGKARAPPLSAQTSIDSMSESQLKAVTARNRARNEVYFSVISKSVVRKDGPRPPSPTIRTIAEREAAERLAGRGVRAKHRGKHQAQSDDQDEHDSSTMRAPPTNHLRGAGDDEDYTTPVRQAKKRKSQSADAEGSSGPAAGKRKRSRATSVVGGKMVRWDKDLVVYSPESLSTPLRRPQADVDVMKSCVKLKSHAELDQLGNIPNASQPVPDIKRIKVHVAVLLYDGEDPPVAETATTAPVPPAASKSRAGGKSKKV